MKLKKKRFNRKIKNNSKKVIGLDSVKKRGISALVAVVLIVLLSVVGVSVIWGVILPMFEELNYFGYSDVKLSLVTDSGYTVYDPVKNFTFVQVSRGNDDKEMVALEFLFDLGGDFVKYRNREVLSPNSKKTYKFNFSRDKIEGTPLKVSISPVFLVDGVERTGSILGEISIPSQEVLFDNIEDWEKADEESGESFVRVIGEEGGEVSIECYDDFGCYSEGAFCENGISYVCYKASDGCLYRANETNCSEGQDCLNDICHTFVNITYINECSLLDIPNSIYRFSSDIVADEFIEGLACLVINAENVTLDGRGYSLREGSLGNFNNNLNSYFNNVGVYSNKRDSNIFGINFLSSGGNIGLALGSGAYNSYIHNNSFEGFSKAGIMMLLTLNSKKLIENNYFNLNSNGIIQSLSYSGYTGTWTSRPASTYNIIRGNIFNLGKTYVSGYKAIYDLGSYDTIEGNYFNGSGLEIWGKYFDVRLNTFESSGISILAGRAMRYTNLKNSWIGHKLYNNSVCSGSISIGYPSTQISLNEGNICSNTNLLGGCSYSC